ncbi:hypothetical protein SD70_24135 [Gordoniibacillus kamchatkensis]|uniref:Uncharacterized protein n=1 Tax=Gordoniibacillus kamchatkensis TaxID=1590651 RepID=A0ABR5ACU4_9BACL|nr:hypothetical protein [Paenibacillus sp. VKM B-2647]KIL38780.1 hypothetical protein SD70_24135 [Paenibacillus sp. VKM B-2647]
MTTELVVLFPYNANIEIVLDDLKRRGYTSNSAMTVPLHDPSESPPTIAAVGTGGRSNWDIGFVLGTIGMLLGSIYGFVWPGGPVLWALAGLIFSFGAGVGLDWLLRIRKIHRRRKRSGIVLWIRCDDAEAKRLQTWLADFGVDGIGVIGETSGLQG